MKLKSNEYPKSHLMNPARLYVNAASTNIAETFARIRAEQAKAAKPASVIRIKWK
jgi:hypothetical protein